MTSDDVRNPPHRYRQGTRVVAVVVSGAFALPVLFVFGMTLRGFFEPPEPSPYAAPTAAPGNPTDATTTAPQEDPASTTAPDP